MVSSIIFDGTISNHMSDVWRQGTKLIIAQYITSGLHRKSDIYSPMHSAYKYSIYIKWLIQLQNLLRVTSVSIVTYVTYAHKQLDRYIILIVSVQKYVSVNNFDI